MERGERIGLGAAVAGHVALLALLSLTLVARPLPVPPEHPIEVSLAPDAGIEATTPVAASPSQAEAPDQGALEQAAPPPPTPEPKPAAKPEPKPVEQPKPMPAPKPAPSPKPITAAKPAAPARSTPAKTKPLADRRLAAIVQRAAATGAGADTGANAARPRASRLGHDFLKGLSDSPSRMTASDAAPAARIGAQQLADIGSAIQRQIQPCANKQVTPGPGAEHIRVAVNLKLNRDGSLAVPPRVVNHDGVDDGNRRYLDRVDDLAIAAFTGCSPLHGLPAALYDAPGGWRSFTLRYKLPG